MLSQTEPQQQCFLNVERSLSGRAWHSRLTDNRRALAISERYDLPEVLGRVLAGRSVELESVATHFNPTLRESMPQVLALRDIEDGARRLADAIVRAEAIGIIGDYDVDGLTSAALLVRFLRAVGSDAEVHIPDRLSEGYGPSRAAVETLAARGVRLLVTADCGVMAHDPLLLAADLGLDSVIVDHHLAPQNLPRACAIINPNRQDDISGLGFLSAAGVTMSLVAVTSRLLREQGWYRPERPEPDLLHFLDLVALGTVCDVVPLLGLNRAYVVQGLKVLGNRSHPGLAALADVSRLKRRPDTHALGYILGPRLNAAGRIGHAVTALKLLLSEDRGESMMIAAELERLNRERQTVELRVIDLAVAQAEAALGKEGKTPVIVVAGEGWHPGVLGLVASRLKERFGLPSFALGLSRSGTHASGSGRSIAGVDMGSIVRRAAEEGLIDKGGGHAMAAGLTVAHDRLGALRAFLESHFEVPVAKARLRNVVEIDGAVSARGANIELVEMLERAGPYGTGNPSPVFAFPAHRVVYGDGAGAGHVRCALQGGDGARLQAVALRSLGTPLGEVLLSERQMPLHVAGRLVADDRNGSRKVQLMIDDVAEVRK
jgi:single-stranded-DNA-specific exonuclease